MYGRQESEYYRAKQKAARHLCRGWVKPADLPSNAEIREEIQAFARLFEGDRRHANLQAMRVEALRLMRILERFRPKLIGSVTTGHIRQGSDIDLHVFSDSAHAVSLVLSDHALVHEMEHKRVKKQGVERIFTHLHVQGTFPIEITVYPARSAHVRFRSSITGKPIERWEIADLENWLREQHPQGDLSGWNADDSGPLDRFQVYESLLLPLEGVKQSLRHHPEGDALYHSQQVFELARDQLPYDEEFLLAALLHDVGKAIDPKNHVAAGLEALSGFISSRTIWLIEHHMLAQRILDGSIGARAHRRLRESPDYEELVLLAECDEGGRQPGVDVPDLDEELDYLRELARMG